MELLAYFLADFGWQKEERGDSDGNTGLLAHAGTTYGVYVMS